MNQQATRDRIVQTADMLFYQQGFARTTFADIAERVKISRGNFYYHFKTKDEILDAVIEARLLKTGNMLDRWKAAGETPADRIRSFINILIMNRDKIKKFGCPVGTLSTELNKLDHTAQAEANKLFSMFRVWLRKQFRLLGRTTDADELAMHFLAQSQGIATLASAFHDEKFIKREVKRLEALLDTYVKQSRKKSKRVTAL